MAEGHAACCGSARTCAARRRPASASTSTAASISRDRVGAVHAALELTHGRRRPSPDHARRRLRSTDASRSGTLPLVVANRAAPHARRREAETEAEAEAQAAARREGRRRRPSSTARRSAGVVDWRAHTIGPIARVAVRRRRHRARDVDARSRGATSWDTSAVAPGAHALDGARAPPRWTRRGASAHRQRDGRSSLSRLLLRLRRRPRARARASASAAARSAAAARASSASRRRTPRLRP